MLAGKARSVITGGTQVNHQATYLMLTNKTPRKMLSFRVLEKIKLILYL